MKSIKNLVIVGFIVLVAYYFAGHDYLRFLLGGKSAMLDVAAQINDLCNTDRSCPTTLEGWQAAPGESVMLSRDICCILPPRVKDAMLVLAIKSTLHSDWCTAFFCRITGSKPAAVRTRRSLQDGKAADPAGPPPSNSNVVPAV